MDQSRQKGANVRNSRKQPRAKFAFAPAVPIPTDRQKRGRKNTDQHGPTRIKGRGELPKPALICRPNHARHTEPADLPTKPRPCLSGLSGLSGLFGKCAGGRPHARQRAADARLPTTPPAFAASNRMPQTKPRPRSPRAARNTAAHPGAVRTRTNKSTWVTIVYGTKCASLRRQKRRRRGGSTPPGGAQILWSSCL